MKQKGPSWIDCRIGKDAKVLPMIPGGGTVHDIIMERSHPHGTEQQHPPGQPPPS